MAVTLTRGTPLTGEDAQYAVDCMSGKDVGVQAAVGRGEKLLRVDHMGRQVTVAWDIDEYIARTGFAPILPSAKKETLPIPGAPHRSVHNIPFVVITGHPEGNQLEVSRDLLAPAELVRRDLGTMPGHIWREQLWHNNLIDNRPFIEAGEPIRRNGLAGKPILLVGAGPSLSKHKELLDNCEFPVLLTNGAIQIVNPRGKMFMSIDYLGNNKWFKGVDCSETEAIFDMVTASTTVSQNWKNRQFFRQTFSTGLANAAAAKWYPKAPTLDPGHCVAYSALHLALWWGCDPIIFVGQDFSYGKELTGHAGDGAGSAKNIGGGALLPVKDINGETVITSELLRSAAAHVVGSVILTSTYGRMWSNHVPRFINCTEEGFLHIPNQMKLADCLDALRKDLPLMQGTQTPTLPYPLRSVRAKFLQHSPLVRKAYRPDSYWSLGYAGPDKSEYTYTELVRVEDATGKLSLHNRKDWAEATKQEGLTVEVVDAPDRN